MAMVKTRDGTDFYYKDWGRRFRDQMFFLVSRGYRCVADALLHFKLALNLL
jgi:non-heme chloroperoxidase